MNKVNQKTPAKPAQDMDREEEKAHAKTVVHSLTDDQLASAAFLAKSLSDANRVRILLLLSSGTKSVSAIVDKLGLSQALVSHHLKELRRSLLLTVERKGPFVYYSLADQRILDVIETLNSIAGQLLAERKTF